MKSMISSIDYIIECRDFRVPITSINPMFEEALGDKQRLIVYTKRDLGGGADDLTRKVNKTRSPIRRIQETNNDGFM
jgi:ribosome biogenesis GTPase A